MPELIKEILIFGYCILTLISVIYPLAYSDEMDKYTDVYNSTGTDLGLCSIVIMLGTITLGSIPYAIFYSFLLKRKKNEYIERKEQRRLERIKAIEEDEKRRKEELRELLVVMGVKEEDIISSFGEDFLY